MIAVHRVMFAAILAAAVQCGFAEPPTHPQPAQASQASPSREEVRADYLVWVQSGMASLVRRSPHEQPNVNSRQYRDAYAKYQQLRNGPEFTALVQRLQGGRGERRVSL